MILVTVDDDHVDVLDDGGNPMEYAVPRLQAEAEHGTRAISVEQYDLTILPHEERHS